MSDLKRPRKRHRSIKGYGRRLQEDSLAAEIFSRGDIPAHIFNIPELDFSTDLFAKRLDGLWLRLGAKTLVSRCDDRNVEDEIIRQSLLLSPEQFPVLFPKLDSVGNVFHGLGTPSGWVHRRVSNLSRNVCSHTQIVFMRFPEKTAQSL